MLLIKIHALLAILSGAGFLVRGIGHIRGQSWVGLKWVRILPHVIDTGLLLSAIALLVVLDISPMTDWVLAKILALALYVFLGVMAFRVAKTSVRKALFWLLALGVFAYMLAVAKTHLVMPWLAAAGGSV